MTNLAKGNRAMQDGKYETAIEFYLAALKETPGLAVFISFNLALARKRLGSTQ